MATEIKLRTVYKLIRTDKPENGTDIYIGSTSQPLKKRLNGHKHYTKIVSNKLYTKMLEVGVDNWTIVPLLIHSCDQKTIRDFERNYIELLNADLNVYSPLGSTTKQGSSEARCCYFSNIEKEKYHCEICNKSFGKIFNLKRHLKSLKHSNAYMNSVD